MSELIPSSSTSRKRPEQSEEEGSQIVSKKAKKDNKQSVAKEEKEDMTTKCLNYTVKDGIRHLSPYWTSYNTYTKRRWVGRTFEEVFSQEFLSVDPNYARVACKFGRIFINDKQMTNPGHVLKDNEKIIHIGHRHELPILDLPIEIIADTDDYLVVNKPPSIPVHACGQYKAHTALARLRAEYGINDLRVVHRLDRATSGVLIFAKNYETDIEFKKNLIDCDWKKEYVCRVVGEFPDGDISCDQPIGNLSPSMGIQCIREDGKESRSIFKKLWSNGNESVVLCKIATGRSHQIRVHLQYLGHPIISDQIYNSNVWGPNKGKNAEYGKPLEQLREDVQNSHKASLWREFTSPDYVKKMLKWAEDDTIIPDSPNLLITDRPDIDPICLGCNAVYRQPSMDHFRMHLHCWKYETSRGIFEATLPDWAKEETEGKEVIEAEKAKICC